jgi:hypothetical protein
MEPFEIIGPDPANEKTHVLILVRGNTYSVLKGSEQATANEIAANLA